MYVNMNGFEEILLGIGFMVVCIGSYCNETRRRYRTTIIEVEPVDE